MPQAQKARSAGGISESKTLGIGNSYTKYGADGCQSLFWRDAVTRSIIVNCLGYMRQLLYLKTPTYNIGLCFAILEVPASSEVEWVVSLPGLVAQVVLLITMCCANTTAPQRARNIV